MAAPVSDEAFARTVQEMGVVTPPQLQAARQLQASEAARGILLTLADALVKQGVLAPATRDNIEKKAQAQATGGVQQLGNYKLLKKLGEGGMGAVYLAEDTMLGRQVAVKVLPKKLTENPEFLSRFKREAKAAGRLNHLNVVGAYATGEEAGQHYYVMEYCEGEPLDKHLKRLKSLPEALVIEIAIQVAQGLQYAHEHGLIHRDIKPGNIFLSREGTAKILDLGLSKDVSGGDQSFQTVSGTALGTPHYISPEQAQAAKDIDGRTDIYSLGATLYHLLTGQTPFHASTAAAILLKHITEQLPDPRDIRPDLSEGIVHVITKAMAKAPADRYANMREMLADLELVKAGEAPSSPAPDAGHSSIAMRAPVRAAGTGVAGAAPKRTSGAGTAGTRRTGERAPVVRDAPAHRRTGRDRQAEVAAAVVPAAPSNRIYFIVGGAVAGVLLLIGLIMAFSGGGKPSATAKAKPEQGQQPASTPTQPTAPEQPAKTVPAAQPEAVVWPLHDGKEPIADYARRVGLPPTETLDLGGGVKMEFVLVPAGEFSMGTDDGEPADKPAHKVRISQPYYVGKYHVTVSQFRAFADATGYQTVAEKSGGAAAVKDGKWQGVPGTTWRTPGYKQEDNYPVVVVTWDDAQEFCKWATTVARRPVQLPTEAEWEYAARGPRSSRYPWGDKWEGVMANVADASLRRAGFSMQYGEVTEDDGFAFTSPVGAYKNASWCGAFDMAGNVWQWCQDYYNNIYYTASPPADPPGPAIGGPRVMRGGGWDVGLGGCYSAHRHGDRPWLRFTVGGFRAVMASSRPGDAPVAVQPGVEKGVTDAWIKSVQALPAEQQVEEVVKKLKELNPGWNGPVPESKVEIGFVTALHISSNALRDLSPVRALTGLRFLECKPHLQNTGGSLENLAPLGGMQLHMLAFQSNGVRDLAPIKGMPLRNLFVAGNPVEDLSVLSTMSATLVGLDAKFTRVRDLSQVKDLPLKWLRWDVVAARDHAILKSMKTLETINDMPVAEFWKKYPETGTAKSAVGNVDDPERWKNAIDLLALIDPVKDTVSGTWSVRDGALSVQQGPPLVAPRIEMPYRPPAEYDFRIVFARVNGNLDISQVLSKSGKSFVWHMGSWSNSICGFDLIDGKNVKDNSSSVKVDPCIQRGRRYTSVVEVRNGGIKAYLDGRLLTSWATDYHDMGIEPGWKLRDSALLGVGTYCTWATFHSVEVCEVSGKGTFTRPDDPAAKEAKKKQDEVWAKREKAGAAQPGAGALPKELSLDLGGGVKMEFVLVPAGEFDMGSNDADARPEEKPVHRVKISKPYYIGKHDVTVVQFRSFADAMKFQTEAEKQNKGWTVKDGKWQEVRGASWRNPGFKQEDNHPVVVVTWNDAREVCRWATKATGRTVRLPTEAEWEYAARGPKSPKYPWGDKWEGIMANVADASLRRAGFNMQWGEIKEDDGYPFTSPGGAYKNASWCGAYDMAGNVWQWCQDYWNDKSYADSPAVDPPGPATGTDRVHRGGCWLDAPGRCRSARRYGYGPGGRDANCGFRVVVEPATAP